MDNSDFFVNTPGNMILPNLTSDILTRSRAMDYHQSLPAYRPTPLVSLPNLAARYHVGNIYIKDDSQRFGLNAFKGLGACYAIDQVIKKQPGIQTFCTATDGNHGRAVAWASKMANKNAVIFVPVNTSMSRIQAIKNEGARVVKTKGNYDQTCAVAHKESIAYGWQLVQDTAWENYQEIPSLIMAGYLTQFQELETALHGLPKSKIDIVFLQAGVGSWAAAAIWYYLKRYGSHRPKIVIVEPREADGILASFKANKRVSPDGKFNTIMAGLNCGIPSLNAWEIIKSGADVSIRIKDEFAEQAIRELYYPIGSDRSIIAGESGVGGLAGFIAIMATEAMKVLKEELNISPNTNILCYNTEGATDLNNFNKIIRQGI